MPDRRSGVEGMKVSIRKRIIALLLILILVLCENPMQISAETESGYSVLIWTTALKSDAEDNVKTLKTIYEAYTIDNKKISCDQEIS